MSKPVAIATLALAYWALAQFIGWPITMVLAVSLSIFVYLASVAPTIED